MSYNLGTASGQIVIDGSKAKKGFSVAETAAASFKEAVRSQMDAIDSAANSLLVMGATGSGAMALVSNTAANFEARLSAIKAVSGATAEEMNQVSAAALRLGADTSFSATEAAVAIEELIKAGLSVPDVLNGAADAAVSLAEAGEISLPRAAEIAANAMNNFKLSGEDMPKVADLIAGAANASAISVEEFGSSLSQAGAVAAVAGVSLDDTAVAIAEMGNAGIKGSDAGTSLKTMFMNLIPTTDRQKEKFDELNITALNTEKAFDFLSQNGFKPLNKSTEEVESSLTQYARTLLSSKATSAQVRKEVKSLKDQYSLTSNAFFDAEGNMKGLSDIQGVLKDVTKDMTKEQKLMNLELMFGADAIRAAAIMSEQGSEGFDKMAESMGKVTAADVAKTRMDNLKGAIEEMKGALETLSISIGNYFLKPMRSIVTAITNVVNWINQLPEGFKAAAAALLVFGTSGSLALGIFIKLIPAVISFLSSMLGLKALSGVFKIFTSGAAALRGGKGLMGALTASGAAASKFGAWILKLATWGKRLFTLVAGAGRIGAAFTAIASGPIGWVVGIVTALGLAGKALYDNWEPFRNLVDKIGASIKDYFAPAMEQAKAGVEAMISAFKTGEGGANGFMGVMQGLGKVARYVVDSAKQIGAAFMANVVPALKSAGGTLLTTMVNAWQTLSSAFTGSVLPALKNLGNIIMTSVWPAIQNLAKALWPIIKVVGMVAGAILGGIFIALKTLVTFLVSKVYPVLIQFYANYLSKVIEVVAKVGSWILKFLVTPLINLVGWIAQAASAVVNWVAGLISGFTSAKETTGGFFTAIGDWLSNLWTNISTIFNNIFTAIVTPFVNAWNFIQPVLSMLWSFISMGFQLIYTVVSSIVRVMWEIIRQVFEIGVTIIWGILVNLGRLISTVWDGIKAVITTVAGVIWTFLQAWFNTIKTVWTAVWNTIKTVVTAVWTGIKAVISAAITVVKTVISAAMSVIKALWNTAWNAIKAVIAPIWNAIKAAVSGPLNSMKSTISSVMKSVKAGWDAAWTAIKNTVSKAVASVKGAAQNVVNGVKNTFSGAIGWLAQAGRDIIQGAINGIKSMADKAVGAIKDVGSRINNGFKAVLGINSPSKEFIKFAGYIIEGLTKGLDKYGKNATTAAMKLGENVKKGVESWKGVKEAVQTKLATINKAFSQGTIKTQAQALSQINSMSTALTGAWKAAVSAEASAVQEERRKANQKISKANSLARDNQKRVNEEVKKIKAAYKKAGKTISDSAAKSLAMDNLNLKKSDLKIKDLLPSISAIEANKIAKGNLSSMKTIFGHLQTAVNMHTKTTASLWKNGDAAGAKAVTNLIKTYQKAGQSVPVFGEKLSLTIRDVGKALEVTNKQLTEQKNKLDSLKKAQADYITKQKEALVDFASGMKNFQQGQTAGDILQGMRDNLKKMQEYQTNLAKLRNLGLSESSMSEILEQGIGGADYVSALVAGGATAVQEMNKLQAEVDKVAGTLSKTMGDQMYGAGISMAEGLVKGLEDQKKVLEATMKSMGATLVTVIKKELGIKSPSRVLDKEVGVQTALGLIRGVERQKKAVAKTMKNLVNPDDALQSFNSLRDTFDNVKSKVVVSAGDNGISTNASMPLGGTSVVTNDNSKGINLTVNWHAAKGDQISTRDQVVQMLGKATDSIRKTQGIL